MAEAKRVTVFNVFSSHLVLKNCSFKHTLKKWAGAIQGLQKIKISLCWVTPKWIRTEFKLQRKEVIVDIFKVKLFTVLLVECTALWDSEMWVWETFCSIVSLKQLTSPDILLQICISCSYISYFPFDCFYILLYWYCICIDFLIYLCEMWVWEIFCSIV